MNSIMADGTRYTTFANAINTSEGSSKIHGRGILIPADGKAVKEAFGNGNFLYAVPEQNSQPNRLCGSFII